VRRLISEVAPAVKRPLTKKARVVAGHAEGYAGAVDERLVEFGRLLRQNGLRVSPGELAAAAHALELVPLDEKPTVRAALRATLVKRQADAPVFDRLFELQFGAIGRLLEGLEETLARGLSTDDLTMDELMAVAKALQGDEAGASVVQALAGGDLGALAKLMRAAALKLDFTALRTPLQTGFYGRRVASAAGLPQLSKELRALEDKLRASGIDPSTVERVSERLGAAVEALEETARRVAEQELEARTGDAKGGDAARQKQLSSLTPDELARMQVVVRQLAQRLKGRIARKRRERRRGALNLRRTLRRNLGHDGLPARLSFRQRRPDKPDVVVLCDVSDSVRNASRLMLQFIHTLQSLYTRVRSFVFVSDLGEATRLFKDASIDEAVDGAVAGKVIDLAAHSNYGRALRLFHDDFRGVVTRRTTLLVIGDGRSNYNPANAWVLEELRRRARRIVWLCPEDESGWGFGDSEMPLYARHCDRVFAVQSLDDLARAAEQLLP
jgi:uncharacterized protein with von Willebrand factor type A (vWA) domain